MSLLLMLLAAAPALALEVPPLQGRVNDLAGVLSAAEHEQLERLLQGHEQRTQQQFAFLSVKSLEGAPIEDFSIRVVEQWKLGTAADDNGLLLVIAVDDRAMRIEVGYGLEGKVTDALSGRIVRDVLAPSFRAQRYSAGITAAFGFLIKAAGGEPVELPQRARKGSPEWNPLSLVGLLLMASLLFFGGRRRGVWIGGIGGPGRRGAGWGGFSGGRGGFGGGGGGFGGGGASGRW